MPNLSQPLTDPELERLEDFLYSVNADEAMSLEEMDGFFCALICSPDLVPPSEYLPHLWGGEHVQHSFQSIEEAQEILTLISRHWNTIAAILLRDEPYPALMGEYEDGNVTGQEWALGFLQGMYLREKPWEQLLKDEQFGAMLFLFPVMVLAEDEEHRLTSAPVTAEDRDTALDALANTVLLIYRYFRSTVKPQRRVAKKRSASKKRTR
jgi:uncharacterized protein